MRLIIKYTKEERVTYLSFGFSKVSSKGNKKVDIPVAYSRDLIRIPGYPLHQL